MNLLDKIWFGLLTFAALIIFSCEDTSDVGLGLDPNGIGVDVRYAELPLEAKNVRLDSIRTSNDARLLIGKNADPVFGTTESILYSRLNFSNALKKLTDDFKYVVDCTVITLHIKKVHASDLSGTQSFKVHQLADTLFSTGLYLSNFKTPYLEDKVEGSFDFTLSSGLVDDLDNDSTYLLRFNLNDEFGEHLFGIRQGEIGKSSSSQSTLDYEYKGIAIVGDPSNTALIGLAPLDSSKITVHYHIIDPYVQDGVNKDSVEVDSLKLQITMGSANSYYNYIKTDRSGSLMANEKGNYNTFTVGDGKIYLQPVSGIFPKVNLDTLVSFMRAHPNIQINRMELQMEASKNTKYYHNVKDLRFLYVGASDGAKINPQGLSSNSVSAFSKAAIMSDNGYIANRAEAVVAKLDKSSPIYSGVPTFFAQLVEAGTVKVEHVMLVPSDATTPDFSIFDEDSGFKVKLYYTIPK